MRPSISTAHASLFARGLSLDYDCEWLWVRSDLIILSVLAVLGTGVGAAYADINWSDTSRTTASVLSANTCGFLGKFCVRGRLSVLSVWPIVAVVSLELDPFRTLTPEACRPARLRGCLH